MRAERQRGGKTVSAKRAGESLHLVTVVVNGVGNPSRPDVHIVQQKTYLTLGWLQGVRRGPGRRTPAQPLHLALQQVHLSLEGRYSSVLRVQKQVDRAAGGRGHQLQLRL